MTNLQSAANQQRDFLFWL